MAHCLIFPSWILLLLLHVYSSSPAPTDAGDREALLSFKSHTSSDPLGALDSWTTNGTSDPCRWLGVACGDGSRRVTSLLLDGLNLAGTIPPSIANLSHLSVLSLSGNRLSGKIPEELGRLRLLAQLDLGNNSLSGPIPANLTQCERLWNLSLYSNSLSGEIPSGIGQLSKLLLLDLFTNSLSGSIPESIGNLSSLLVLDLSENSLHGGFPESLHGLINLQYLQLSFNMISGGLLPSLVNSSSILSFDVGNNLLSGHLPSDLGSHLPQIQKLYLYQNQFTGSIPISIANASNLLRIGFEVNRLTGVLPREIGAIPGLSWLALGNNELQTSDPGDWQFLDALSNCSDLQVFDISGNMFRSPLPGSIANLSTQLQWISMENNRIEGSIPEGIGRYTNLTFLSMYNNRLQGQVPASIGQLANLNILRLFGNRLDGTIPDSLGNLTQLNELNLGRNGFVGNIPPSIGNLQNLNLLNLSYNELNGVIPKEIAGLSSLTKYLDASHNSLIGAVPVAIGSLKNLLVLNVSHNNLSGEIPSTLGECQALGYLHMEGNMLQGEIPPALSNLKGLEELDLSRNNLSGTIPEFLATFQSLFYLNLSSNDFEGDVPIGGIFQNQSAFSVAGNRRLCVGKEDTHTRTCSIPTSGTHKSDRVKVIAIIAGVVAFFALMCLFAIVIFLLKTRKRYHNTTITSSFDSLLSYSELNRATDEFSSSNLIGTGGFGAVYKGILDDENVVAIKVLNLEKKGASKSFMAECEVLRNVRHRNLAKIITTCTSLDYKGNEFKALVMEFMPNGSLENWLHPAKRESGQLRNLSFIKRLNIAVDVAHALDYLHNYSQPPIVHCDLKPSNILLDDDFVAHVSDFGLAMFLPLKPHSFSENPISSIGIKGSIGYIAPEYGMGRKASPQGDVYSYGILLLEMFTGKRPTDEKYTDGFSLRKYAEIAFPDNVAEIIDPNILVEGDNYSKEMDIVEICKETIHDCLVNIIRIALSCSNESPIHRKNIGHVVNEMVSVKNSICGEMDQKISPPLK